MTPLAIGAHVGQYVVVREVGKGAMATVYEARHAELGKHVALKVMHPHLAVDPTAASRFLREGKAAAQIHNPHVVDVYDVGTHEGVPYLVMELLDGPDLALFLRSRAKLPLGELADVMLAVASAVHAAHSVGVIHRDLKPSNIVLAKRATGLSPTVLDFGISKVTSDVDRDLTASEVLLGTVHYMSPEQTRGGRNASALSDQYSLGVLLYECATGIKPFSGSSPYALMHAIVSSKVTAPSSVDPALPDGFDAVVLRAMHRDPKRRFADVRELGAALFPWASAGEQARWAGELGVEPSAGTKIPRMHRRARAALVALAALSLSLLALGLSGREQTAPSAPIEAHFAPPVTPPTVGSPAPADPVTVAEPVHAVDAMDAVTPSASAHAPAPPGRAPSRAAAASPRASTASTSATVPERGTNGALIVE
jgi:tRNA A-37 threonylcarbamoyl transferase component Bud32